MKRILFVDDDTNVLNGLRRGLHSMQHEWQMEFQDSGEDALQALSDRTMDAVVTDVRMSEMDGFQLLRAAKKTCPQVVRIVLSGQTQQDEFARCFASTHFFLPKPCDTQLLKRRVGQILANGERIRDTSLKSLISQIEIVPSLPMLVTQLHEECQSEECNIDTIAEIVSMDMGMSSSILHFVNSGYFGSNAPMSSPGLAVRWLGLDTVRDLLIKNRSYTPLDSNEFEYFNPRTLWADSVSCSTAARSIALSQAGDRVLADEAFAAGLFHDVGQLVLASVLRDFYDDIVRRATFSGKPLWKIERELIGSTHAEVGAFLLGLWGLPDPVLNAVMWHHDPADGDVVQVAVHAAEQRA